jgi:hypothetical protein
MTRRPTCRGRGRGVVGVAPMSIGSGRVRTRRVGGPADRNGPLPAELERWESVPRPAFAPLGSCWTGPTASRGVGGRSPVRFREVPLQGLLPMAHSPCHALLVSAVSI